MMSENDKTHTHITLAKDTMVGHYRIVEKIGSGGMGEVYLARDTQLDRKVALKFLPPHLCQDEDCRKRFKREAQAAAKLDHPNIISVYEVSEYHGRPYFAMAHVEGRSLKEVAAGKDLPIEQILELAVQICGGLHAAHDSGIIHRDIKPSNVLIDLHGRVRIVDFGLATVKDASRLTKTGSTMGTAGYMSPEQVRGQEVDRRADLFSLGVVLYEMITGRQPFHDEHEAAIQYNILNEQPEPLARFKAGLPGGLQAIIDKVLDKDVKTRYQHADGLCSDLMRVKRSLESTQPSVIGISPKKKSPVLWWMVAAVVVIVGVALFITKPWEFDTMSAQQETIMLAVLPFENLGNPEDEYFADGITDEIISRLAMLTAIRVISRTSSMQYKDTHKDLPVIARELGVEYILEGTIRWDKSGDTDRVRITPQLIRASDNSHLWAEQYSIIMADIFEAQSSIAEKVAEALDITLLESEKQALVQGGTDNSEAYGYYLRGHEYFMNHTVTDYRNAEEMFLKAVELDSSFALAYAWLSIVHTQIYAWYIDRTDERLAAAEKAARRAVEIEPDPAITQWALAWYHYRCLNEPELALEEFIALRRRTPSDAALSLCIAKIEMGLGIWGDVVADFERAIRLDPLSSTYRNEYGFALFCLRRYDEAETQWNRALELKPDFRMPHRNKSLVCLYRDGDITGARRVLKEALRKTERWPGLTSMEASLEIIAGDYERALALLTSYGESDDLTAYDSAVWLYNLKGSVYCSMNKQRKMAACYDSARILLERLVHEDTRDPWNHTALGVAYAGLGRTQEAIEEGRLGVELAAGAIDEFRLTQNLACIYALVGKYDLAVDQLDYLLSVPSEMSVAYLKICPDFKPLRDHPRFKALLEKYEKIHGT